MLGRVRDWPREAYNRLRNVLGRVVLWARANERMQSIGQTFDRQDAWYQWRLGATEKHCADCLKLNGQIHRASRWRAAGIQPQSPDLECGGWNCDCRLVKMPDNYNGGEVGGF